MPQPPGGPRGSAPPTSSLLGQVRCLARMCALAGGVVRVVVVGRTGSLCHSSPYFLNSFKLGTWNVCLDGMKIIKSSIRHNDFILNDMVTLQL